MIIYIYIYIYYTYIFDRATERAIERAHAFCYILKTFWTGKNVILDEPLYRMERDSCKASRDVV